jgi:MFS transporter, Spinster family, sphingosine-1-phosphate transporter
MHIDEAIGPAPTPPAMTARRWASVTFLVLFTMNLLDYVDRWVLAAVLPQIRSELDLSNAQAGWLATLFLISYSLISPVMGYAGDRTRRTWLLGLGVGVWSLATVGTGLARTYGHLQWARAFLGIGEATYGVIAPTILMDLYSRETRARVLSAFYLAMPIGGALGMVLGAWIAKHYGWQAAFFVVGVPGLFAAIAAPFLPEPIRGASEKVEADRLEEHARVGVSRDDYLELLVNSSFNYSVFGMTFYTFAIGGLAFWLPTFLTVTKGIEPVKANTLLGIATLFAAIIGMSLGGWLADRLARTNPRALFVVPGVALIAAVPFVLVAVYSRSLPWIYAGIFLSEALMFINTGPCNAVIANVVLPNMRAAAFAVAIFVVHFLGDIWSPTLMGWVADFFGHEDSMATGVGRALTAIGAVPAARPGHDPENLTAGILIVVPAVFLAGVVLLAGARHVPREMALMVARLKARPRGVRA